MLLLLVPFNASTDDLNYCLSPALLVGYNVTITIIVGKYCTSRHRTCSSQFSITLTEMRHLLIPFI